MWGCGHKIETQTKSMRAEARRSSVRPGGQFYCLFGGYFVAGFVSLLSVYSGVRVLSNVACNPRRPYWMRHPETRFAHGGGPPDSQGPTLAQPRVSAVGTQSHGLVGSERPTVSRGAAAPTGVVSIWYL